MCVCGGGGGGGPGTPLKNHKNIEFFSKPGPDPPKITNFATKSSFNVGPLNGVLLEGR